MKNGSKIGKVLLVLLSNALALALIAMTAYAYVQKTKTNQTEEQVIRILETYASEGGDSGLTQEEVKTLSRSIAKGLDDELLSQFNSQVNEELFHSMMLYVDGQIQMNAGNISETTRNSLTQAIVQELANNYSLNESQEKINQYDTQISNIMTEMKTLQQELKTVNSTQLATLTEVDVQRIIQNTGLSEATVKSWATAGLNDVTNAYKRADKEVLDKAYENDEQIKSSLKQAQNVISKIQNDLQSQNSSKMDQETAQLKIDEINKNIDLLTAALKTLSKSSDGDTKELSQQIASIVNDLSNTKTTLLFKIQEINDEYAERTQALNNDLYALQTAQNTFAQLTSSNFEMNEEELARAKQSLESSINALSQSSSSEMNRNSEYLTSKINEVNNALSNVIAAKNSDNEKALADAKTELNNALNNTQDALNAEIASCTAKINSLSQTVENNKQYLEGEINNVEATLSLTKTELQTAIQKSEKDVTDKINASQSKLEDRFQNVRSTLENTITVTERDLRDSLNTTKENLESEIDTTNNNVSTLQNAVDDINGKIVITGTYDDGILRLAPTEVSTSN